MDRLTKLHWAILIFACLVFHAAAQTPRSPVFYKTRNSDEWVRKSLKIQSRYARVLLVNNSTELITDVCLASLYLTDILIGDQLNSVTYPVTVVNKTFQEAVVE